MRSHSGGAWKGLTLRAAGSREAIDGDLLAGTVLCGHDGRNGYLYHLAVAPSHRRQGIGRLLVERSLAGLRAAGFERCHLFVHTGNAVAREFSRRSGWVDRTDLAMMTIVLNAAP